MDPTRFVLFDGLSAVIVHDGYVAQVGRGRGRGPGLAGCRADSPRGLCDRYPKDEERREFTNLAGVAIWASVSGDVDANIRQQIKGGMWPLRLKPKD